jgi:orotate phosphoribosyltransferase
MVGGVHCRMPRMADFRQEFLSFCIESGVLRFGSFVTKSGRTTPYFFNAGLFDTGAKLDRLAGFYATSIIESGLAFDVLFGPAYKGIPLVAGTAMALSRRGRDAPYAFNRKEAKDHGEGGSVIGAPLAGRVLIVDDVITAGTAVGESVAVIRAAGAVPAGVAVSLDRMEKGKGALSAIQEVRAQYGMPVVVIATLDDLLHHLRLRADLRQNIVAIEQYRQLYGATQNV